MDEGEETGGQGLLRRRRGVRAHDVPADALISLLDIRDISYRTPYCEERDANYVIQGDVEL